MDHTIPSAEDALAIVDACPASTALVAEFIAQAEANPPPEAVLDTVRRCLPPVAAPQSASDAA